MALTIGNWIFIGILAVIGIIILIFCHNIETYEGFPRPGNARYKANTFSPCCFCIINNFSYFGFAVVDGRGGQAQADADDDRPDDDWREQAIEPMTPLPLDERRHDEIDQRHTHDAG